jgi:tetratricopeptide (TPR) repeat protein
MRSTLVIALLIALPAAAQAPPDEKALEAEVRKDPRDGRAWLRLGMARQGAKKWEAAAEAYRKAIDLKFGVPVAAYNLATVHAARGDRDQAFAALEQAAQSGFARFADAETDPDLAALRGDPRWNPTMKRLAEAAFPCRAGARHRELDFWIGEWEVRAAQGHLLGTSSVKNIIEGCVIFENWSGSLGHAGKSFNFYDTEKEAWRQVWVDDGGRVTDYVGQLRDGAMRFEAESKGAKRRMTFTPQPDGRVRQYIEQSSDGGKTWTAWFDGFYGRKK